MAKRTYKDLLDVVDLRDINRMSEKELRQNVRILADIANKRSKSLSGEFNKSALYSPALETLTTEKGLYKFSTAGKSKEDLAREFMKARNFLSAKTSTIKGTREYAKSTKERLGYKNMSNTDLAKVFKVYSELQDEIVTRHRGSRPTQEEIATLVAEGKTSEEIRDYFRLRYEEYEAERAAELEKYENSEWDDIE